MTRIEAVILYAIGIAISIAFFCFSINVINEMNDYKLNFTSIAATGIANVFLLLVQLFSQIKSKKFQRQLLFESLLVVFIYINMCGFHAYGNWMYNLAIVYIIITGFIVLKNILKLLNASKIKTLFQI